MRVPARDALRLADTPIATFDVTRPLATPQVKTAFSAASLLPFTVLGLSPLASRVSFQRTTSYCVSRLTSGWPMSEVNPSKMLRQ